MSCNFLVAHVSSLPSILQATHTHELQLYYGGKNMEVETFKPRIRMSCNCQYNDMLAPTYPSSHAYA